VSQPTALFITCLVDQFFPEVGEATVRLLRQAGSRVTFPREQTCCGQPAFNTGYREEAAILARRFIEIFEPYREIVAPSGSCVSMVRVFYPELLRDEPVWAERAGELGGRVFELSEFLGRKAFRPGKSSFEARVTWHDPCHLLRELGVREPPRELLRTAPGLQLVEMEGAETCCGFGGAFSVKLPEISTAMLDAKLSAAEASGAQVLASADCGCLMHLRGALERRGSSLRTAHIAELLDPEA
jgi:L-lactate dehydrogenase complex protein LldE